MSSCVLFNLFCPTFLYCHISFNWLSCLLLSIDQLLLVLWVFTVLLPLNDSQNFISKFADRYNKSFILLFSTWYSHWRHVSMMHVCVSQKLDSMEFYLFWLCTLIYGGVSLQCVILFNNLLLLLFCFLFFFNVLHDLMLSPIIRVLFGS